MNEMINYNGEDKFEIFNFENLGSVRTSIGRDGQPLFCLKDVCDTLELRNITDVTRRIDTPYLDTIYVWVQTGIRTDGTPAMRNTPMAFVSEAGLYQAIGQSRKPAAKRFMNWIFSEVIPSIRKTGSYNMIDDESIPIQIRQMNQVTKVVNLMANKLESMQETIDSNYNDLDGKIEDVDEKVDFSLARQDYLIEHGYHSVFQFAQYMGVDVRTINTNNIGRICSKVCRENGIPTGTYPDGKYEVKTYPYKVLSKVFNENVFIYENSN